MIKELRIPLAEVEALVAKEMEAVEREETLYRDERPGPNYTSGQ